MARDGEDRLRRHQAGAGQDHAQTVGRRRRQADEHHGARLELEGQELDPEQGGGDRRAEHGTHACGGTGDEQGAALSRRQMEQLADDGTHRSPGQDDRSLGAERATGSDTDRTRDGLQESQARLDPAAVDEDALHRFGDAVTPDLLGAVTGHETDDQPSPDRDDDGQRTQGVGIGGHQAHAEALVVEQVGEEADHVEQRQRDPRRQQADDDGQRDEAQQVGGGREIGQRALATAGVRGDFDSFFAHRRTHRSTMIS